MCQAVVHNVVICFQISIFEPLETTHEEQNRDMFQL